MHKNTVVVRDERAPKFPEIGSLPLGTLFRYPDCETLYIRGPLVDNGTQTRDRPVQVQVVALHSGMIYLNPESKTVDPLRKGTVVEIMVNG